MNIDYVIISSDDNPLYKDFYEPVSKKWNDLGYKVLMIEICEENSIVENKYGLYVKYKKIDNINSGFLSQISRLYIYKQFKNLNLLISDIDMLPLNGEYFKDIAKYVDNKIAIYSGRPYGNVPYFPMCYILSNGELMSNILNLDAYETFEEFAIFLNEKYKSAWNTDENFFHDMVMKNINHVIIYNRDFNRRIDRSNWKYDDEKLLNGYYIDSHLLRPYSQYKNQIYDLL